MRKGKRLVLAALAAGMLAGCGQTDEVDRSVEIQEETVHENSFELTPVTRGTVQQPLVLNCDYSQTVEVDLYFAVDQEVITDVYVEKGDIVKKGELLASVDVENMEKQVRELEHRLDRAMLSLRQIQENKDIQFKIFSDNIIIAKRVSEDKEQRMKDIRSLLMCAGHLQELAASDSVGWMLRGGITIGQLFIDDVMV